MGVYYDKDADVNVLAGKTIAVIGYGIQGAAQAQCLKDSGLNVVVGLRENGSSWEKAKADGMQVMQIKDAAAKSDVVCLLTPDMTHKKIFEDELLPFLTEGKTLYFSHGFSITYGLVKPPVFIDVVMVAPKSPGAKVREAFVSFQNQNASAGKILGVPCLFAVHQDYSKKAKQTALALAKAMRLTKAGAFECTFDQETYSDLFGEQAVLCGGVTELIKAGFEILTQKGYPPELAYFEVLHELKLITDLVQEGGLEYMWGKVSETARFGGRSRAARVITQDTREEMKKMLNEIEDGTFAHEWLSEYHAGMPRFYAMEKQQSQHPIELVGKKIRAGMRGEKA